MSTTVPDPSSAVRRAQAAAVRAAAESLCRGEDEFPVMHAARCAPLLAYADQLEAIPEEAACLAS